MYVVKVYSSQCLERVSLRKQTQKELETLRGVYRREDIHLTPNDHHSVCTAPLNSKSCILFIYSTNTGTEYFKHGINSPFLFLQNALCFIIQTYLVPVLFTFYIQDVL